MAQSSNYVLLSTSTIWDAAASYRIYRYVAEPVSLLRSRSNITTWVTLTVCIKNFS